MIIKVHSITHVKEIPNKKEFLVKLQIGDFIDDFEFYIKWVLNAVHSGGWSRQIDHILPNHIEVIRNVTKLIYKVFYENEEVEYPYTIGTVKSPKDIEDIKQAIKRVQNNEI